MCSVNSWITWSQQARRRLYFTFIEWLTKRYLEPVWHFHPVAIVRASAGIEVARTPAFYLGIPSKHFHRFRSLLHEIELKSRYGMKFAKHKTRSIRLVGCACNKVIEKYPPPPPRKQGLVDRSLRLLGNAASNSAHVGKGFYEWRQKYEWTFQADGYNTSRLNYR